MALTPQKSEKKVAFSVPLSFRILWPVSTRLCGRIALVVMSLLETCPQILERTDCAYEDWCAESHLAMEVFFITFQKNATRISHVANNAGTRNFVSFRTIDLKFFGSMSWNTQPNCSAFFHRATEPFPPPFFGRLFG